MTHERSNEVYYIKLKITIFLMFMFLLHISLNGVLSSKYLQETEKGKIYFLEDDLQIVCRKHIMISQVFAQLRHKTVAESVVIEKCVLPPIPIAETLEKLNIQATEINTLELRKVKPLSPGNYTYGLNLDTLKITSVTSAAFKSVQNKLISNFNNLTTIILSEFNAPSLPLINHPYNLMIFGAWVKNWNNCQYMRTITFLDIDQALVPQNFSLNCPRLTHVVISPVPKQVLEILLNSIHPHWGHINGFGVIQNKLTHVPMSVLNLAKKLRLLEFKGNILDDKSFENFPLLQNLMYLSLESNFINGNSLPKLLKQLPRLDKIKLGKNKLIKCGVTFLNMTAFADAAPYLTDLSLDETNISISCFKNILFRNLNVLNLMKLQRQFSFHLNDLPKTNSPSLKVDLRGQQQNILFGYKDYLLFSRKDRTFTNLTIFMDAAIDCTCDHYWLGRALIKFSDFLTISKLLCKNTPAVTHFYNYFKRLRCDDSRTELQYALSVEDWDKGVILDLHNNSNVNWQKIYDLHYQVDGLNISGSKNITLFDSGLPRTLLDLDLQNCNLSLGAKELTRLFDVSKRRVWLSGNIFICDCEHKLIVDTLYQYRNQVMDFIQLKCLDNNGHSQLLYSVSLEMCTLRYPLALSGTVLVLMAVAALEIWKYRLKVKVYLYTHGFCLSCLRQEEIDADRPYDAFLSFTHGDDEYVLQELLPKLEGEPYSYRICVHYRDWMVGDWIPRQISRSVRLSKRTIIVLSKKFVESQWGNLEFRYAVAGAAQESRSRLIILVFDDVLEGPLSEKLQRYLSMNTYMHCQDPWFWQKLSYAMPHSKPTKTNCVDTPKPSVGIPMEILPQCS